MRRNKQLKRIRDEVIAGIVKDRNFDIPIEIYDMIDWETVREIINRVLYDSVETFGSNVLHDLYVSNDDAKLFFDIIRLQMSNSRKGRKMICTADIPRDGFSIQTLLMQPTDWYKANYVLGDYAACMEQILRYPELDFQVKGVWQAFVKQYREKCKCHTEIHMFITMMKLGHMTIEQKVRLAYLLDFHKNNQIASQLLEIGVPILPESYDVTDVWCYLTTVLASEYRGVIDERCIKLPSSAEETMLESEEFQNEGDDEDMRISTMLWEIGNTLNHVNYKFYYEYMKRVEPSENINKILTSRVGKNMCGYKIKPNGHLKDFSDLVKIGGNNEYGYSVTLQRLFLEMGGDIETMFDETTGKLMPEASIIRMVDQLPKLLELVSTNSLRFLLHNSPEFVKNVMVANGLTTAQLIHIARALMPSPVDEELWYLINGGYNEEEKDEEEPLDYRVVLIDKVSNLLPRDVLFDNVPEAMAYIEPSAKYIVRNISDNNMIYIPANKLTPYIRQFIATKKYQRMNLFCNGREVSIQSAVNDPKFIMDIIVNDEKFGYICDTQCDDMNLMMELVVEKLAAKRGIEI